MFAQLGNIQFDSTNSFVSFSDEEEAVIVEHALIGRKARLQATAIGLRTITVSLFLHQEFCKVSDSINSLRNYKNNFESLPLLWGNGVLEGEFVIASMSRSNEQQDGIGNLIAARINLTLKENYIDDKLTQQQQDSRNNAFAVGDKKPTTKSNRVNTVSCNKKISNIISLIKSNSGQVDVYSRQYSGWDPVGNLKIKSFLNVIITNAQKLIDAVATTGSCVYGMSTFGNNASSVKSNANEVLNIIEYNITGPATPLFQPNVTGEKTANNNLQASVKALLSSSSGIIKSSITS